MVNFEVPVRVFEGNDFVGNLSLDDFQILEDGIPQKIEAVHLVKNKTILRSEGKERLVPETSRSFFLFFEISQYSPKLKEAIDYFFQNVFLPGDDLIFVSPLKTYQLKEIALNAKSKPEIHYVGKGAVAEGNFLNMPLFYKVRLDYIEISFLMKYRFFKTKKLQPNLFAGGYTAFNIAAKTVRENSCSIFASIRK